MNKLKYIFKLEKIDSLSDDVKQQIKDLFIRLSPENQKNIFSEKEIYISGTNLHIGNLIFEKLSSCGVDILKAEKISDEFINSFSVIFPLPERNDIYDVIHISQKNNILSSSTSQALKNLDSYHDESLNLKFGISCTGCYKQTPDKISFCIYCGHEFIKKESLKSYSVKITNIEGTTNKIKTAKYMHSSSSLNDYQKMMDYLTRLPTIFNFYTYPSQIESLFNTLKEYGATYYLIDSEAFSFEKIYSAFIPYGSLNIGTMHIEKSYIDPIVARLAIDCIQNSASDVLKKIVTKCLFEVYRINEMAKNSDTNSKILLEETEKDINELLAKFLYFIKRADQLNIYFSEHTPEKINKEIEILKDKILKSDNKVVLEMYNESLILKEKEYNDLISLSNTIEILNSQIISVMTIISSMRTKITYLSNFDLQKNDSKGIKQMNKGDFTELNNLKSNLIVRLKSIEETLAL